MKKYGRIFLALAILFGLAAQAQATSYDPTNLVQPQVALRMNQGGQGDALIGEWYRATIGTQFNGELDNANFLTYVSIVNTSGDWVAAHVRLRSGRFSIEVIDFPILLSPYDVFWFQFEGVGTAATGLTGVKIWSADTKTVKSSGLSSTGVWEANLSPAILASYTQLPDEYKGIQELAIGYIEVIGLWKLQNAQTGGPVSESALQGVTFQALQSRFYNGGKLDGEYFLDPTNQQSFTVVPVDLGNVLTGQVFMGDFTNGLYTGYSMTALADFRSNCEAVLHRDEAIRGVAAPDRGVILYDPLSLNNDARVDIAYTDPDWATNFGPTWNDGDDFTQGAKGATGSYSLDEVDDALAKQKVTSTYFNGGFREERTTFTMATITFPTKYLHINFKNFPVGNPAAASEYRDDLEFDDVPTLSLYGRIFNLDELQPYDPTSPEPFFNLKWEVNCLPIGVLSRAKLAEFCFLTHDDPSFLNVNSDFYAGWFELKGFGFASGDPRNWTESYDRDDLPLLNCLKEKNAFNSRNLIPALVQILDFEFANFLHARSFVPAWDNPNNCNLSTAPSSLNCVPQASPSPTPGT